MRTSQPQVTVLYRALAALHKINYLVGAVSSYDFSAPTFF
jgi:hypothetical protein